jgi:hypothetical protein
MDWLWMKGIKEQIGSVFLGLFRPLRPDVSAQDLANLRLGGTVADLTEPNTLGICGMKRRHGGAVRDPIVKLHYEHGVIRERETPDRLADEAAEHGIATRPWYT